jgi:hypothetical protein
VIDMSKRVEHKINVFYQEKAIGQTAHYVTQRTNEDKLIARALRLGAEYHGVDQNDLTYNVEDCDGNIISTGDCEIKKVA